MADYVCARCRKGFYEEDKGDPSQGIAAGTSFDDLPADFKCPNCEASKEEFIPTQGEEVQMGGRPDADEE